MNQQEIKDIIVSKFGEESVQWVEFRDQITLTVPKERILEICEFLKTSEELAFDFLSFVAGVDNFPATPRFEMVYQFHSSKKNHRFRIKTIFDENDSIDSVINIWPTADWHEREMAEMFGIKINGHPDLRKLLLPEDWTIHPLRKDFPLEGTPDDTPDLSCKN
jgi:NADH-quinone oxidoreductase subunit C